MSGLVAWALLNGLITGGVWAGIVLLRRQRRLFREELALLEDVRQHLDERDRLERRLMEVEERLDFAERLLAREREGQRLAPPRE
jgi:hypothetical protein